ncbi:CDP-diacylglycerol--serine O-phosphatidyltransferase [Paenibacillus shunpengii]|uniref:CDP-diacylglycerol--serine O-phosphatidyltransferase n=1 Tax=Paenibacillus shunpengii TaxID=2054424 RepID=A0ABW5SW83_9BACL|nr:MULTISPECIES: CDP-diacylglycerol--serine O-phosphatidyltransferase [unclassified Paenibacillus]OMC62981.1 CDP-diacylglycerol--serine O-phosphatidyltransferase [Paenibacillus sp. FSL H7-0326]SDX77618.1 CDP-diacylglycerol---serine O-phosphatidyltransferase [Paenibacillus sp. PDC88]
MITKSIPNLFTLGNLSLGMIAILLASEDQYTLAAFMVVIAMLLDGLDGRIARALNAQSEFGKELDSLSDIVSFGAAPAYLMYTVSFQEAPVSIAWIVTSIFPICGALRLARFNVKPGIPGYFTGLPIPAAGGVLALLSLFNKDISAPFMMVATLLLSYLMISSLKYPNFKKVGIPKKAVWIAPLVVLFSIALAFLFSEQLSMFVFIPLVLYAVYGMYHSVQRYIHRRRNRNKSQEDETSHRY